MNEWCINEMSDEKVKYVCENCYLEFEKPWTIMYRHKKTNVVDTCKIMMKLAKNALAFFQVKIEKSKRC